ncbi:MAG: CsgG/HfaB family protein [Verrucomicrobia bacterium]|nr:CsgG/HfaB family protein [Verrucomicrobiota bacterium]
MKKVLIVALIAALTVLTTTDSWALWGKATTATSDGDADMGLGEYKGLKHAVGVKDFDNDAGWRGNWEIGNNLSVMLESALFDTGRFVIVEREKLKEVLGEQDLAASGRTAKAKKVAKTGLIRSAKYLATGAVTEVEENQSGGDGGIRIKGFKVGLGKKDAQVTIIAKLIDTTTSEIVAKKRIVGAPGGIGLNVGYSGSDFGANLGGFKKTPLGQAAQDCINQAAKWFAETMEEIPFEGSVIKVSGSGQAIINRGSQFGVEVGQVLVMREEGETLIDPDSGEILDQEEGQVIGKVRVAKVSEKVSYCDIIEGEEPEAGTVVSAQ